jgi:hypothetical protein
MIGLMLVVAGSLVAGTAALTAAGFGLAVALREVGRRQPDHAWKPTGYRVR